MATITIDILLNIITAVISWNFRINLQLWFVPSVANFSASIFVLEYNNFPYSRAAVQSDFTSKEYF